MKKLIILLTTIITLLGIFITFVILFLPDSNYYFSKAFESMFWVIPTISPILIIIFIVDVLYCNNSSKGWLLIETLIIMLITILFALSRYSFQFFYIFGSMFLCTQIIKYFIFSKYCTIQKG